MAGMERLRRTVVQLEESRRLILDGEVARLRLALILLDNAVEVLLQRVIREKLETATLYARMVATLPGDGSLNARGEALRAELAAKTVPLARQDKIGRFFNEKVGFLVGKKILPAPTGSVLRHLHDYRNEVQHQDHLRTESIRPAVLILFDIVLDLLVSFEPGSVTWESNADYRWLQDYGIPPEPMPFGRDDIRKVIAARLGESLPLDIGGIRSALVSHLHARLDVMECNLAEIGADAGSAVELARTLRHIKRWEQGLPVDPAADSEDAAPFDRLAFIPRWRASADEVGLLSEKVRMFERFAALEDQIEPLEAGLQDIADAIAAAAEVRSDIERGA
jgi:hypothetical protein